MIRLILFIFSVNIITACRNANMNTPTKEALISRFTDMAQNALALTKIDCVNDFEKDQSDILCFAAPYDAEEFMSRVESLADMKNITGWRDDYGTAGAAFQYQNIPREIGFNFTRPNDFWDLPRYAKLRENKAQGYVSIVVTDDDPKTRQ